MKLLYGAKQVVIFLFESAVLLAHSLQNDSLQSPSPACFAAYIFLKNMDYIVYRHNAVCLSEFDLTQECKYIAVYIGIPSV